MLCPTIKSDVVALKSISKATGNAQYLFKAKPPMILSSLLVNTGIAPLEPSIITKIPSIICNIPTNVIKVRISMFIIFSCGLFNETAAYLNNRLANPKTAPEYEKQINLGLNAIKNNDTINNK